MDLEMQSRARDAIARFDHILDRELEVAHADIQAAVNAVVAFRNRAIQKHREGAVSDECLDRANALVSLAYGAEFPLSGLHRRRFERTRDGMRALLQGA
jgi:hypothetical protein